MAGVAATISTKLVLNGSQYSAELERVNKATTRNFREIEKSQARMQTQQRARAMVGLQGADRQRMQSTFDEQDALSASAREYEKIKTEAMASFRKRFAGTDDMEDRMRLAAGTRKTLGEALARYKAEETAVKARYAAERAEIDKTTTAARTAAAAKANAERDAAIARRAEQVNQSLRWQRTAYDPDSGRTRRMSREDADKALGIRRGGEAWSFERMAIGGVKAKIAFDAVTLGLEGMAAAAMVLNDNSASAMDKFGAMAKSLPLIGSSLSRAFSAGEEFWSNIPSFKMGPIKINTQARRDFERTRPMQESFAREQDRAEHQAREASAVKSITDGTDRQSRSITLGMLASRTDPMSAARMEAAEKLRQKEIEIGEVRKELAKNSPRHAQLDKSLANFRAAIAADLAARQQDEYRKLADMDRQTNVLRLQGSREFHAAELAQIEAAYAQKRRFVSDAERQRLDEQERLERQAADRREGIRRRELSGETAAAEARARAMISGKLEDRLTAEEAAIRESFRRRRETAAASDQADIDRQEKAALAGFGADANRERQREQDRRLSVEASIGQRILQLHGRNRDAQLLAIREQYRQQIEEAKRAGDTELADRLRVDQALSEQQAMTQGARADQVQAGRFAVGSSTRNVKLPVLGDPVHTSLLSRIAQALERGGGYGRAA
jgi:hypothetical protein